MSKNLNPSQLVVNLKWNLRYLPNLKILLIFNSSWEDIFILVKQDILVMAQTPS